MSSLIISNYNSIQEKNNELTLNFSYPYESKNEKIAICNLICNYCWFNITKGFNNDNFQYVFNGSIYNVSIPDGFYSIDDINGYLKKTFYENGHFLLDQNLEPVYYMSIQANIVYYCTTLTCIPVPTHLPVGYTNPNGIRLSGETPQLTITSNAFGSLIGFIQGTFPSLPLSNTYMKNSEKCPQISPVTSINVCCSIVNNSRWNTYPDVIHSFSVNSEFGSTQEVHPNQLVFYNITERSYNNIKISLRDQLNRDLIMLDPSFTCTLIIQSRDK